MCRDGSRKFSLVPSEEFKVGYTHSLLEMGQSLFTRFNVQLRFPAVFFVFRCLNYIYVVIVRSRLEMEIACDIYEVFTLVRARQEKIIDALR